MVKDFGVDGVAQMKQLIEMVVVEAELAVMECQVVERFSHQLLHLQVQITEI